VKAPATGSASRLAGEVAALGLDELAVAPCTSSTCPARPTTAPPIVLTPALDEAALGRHAEDAVPTVARSPTWPPAPNGLARRGAVKLASSMRRYGAEPDALAPLLDAVDAAGPRRRLRVHPPLIATGHDNRADVERCSPTCRRAPAST